MPSKRYELLKDFGVLADIIIKYDQYFTGKLSEIIPLENITVKDIVVFPKNRIVLTKFNAPNIIVLNLIDRSKDYEFLTKRAISCICKLTDSLLAFSTLEEITVWNIDTRVIQYIIPKRNIKIIKLLDHDRMVFVERMQFIVYNFVHRKILGIFRAPHHIQSLNVLSPTKIAVGQQSSLSIWDIHEALPITTYKSICALFTFPIEKGQILITQGKIIFRFFNGKSSSKFSYPCEDHIVNATLYFDKVLIFTLNGVISIDYKTFEIQNYTMDKNIIAANILEDNRLITASTVSSLSVWN